MKIMDTIPCPNCGKQIQVTEALKHQLEEKIKAAEAIKYKEELVRLRPKLQSKPKKNFKPV